MKVLPLRVVLVLLALMSSVVLIAQNPISIQRLGTTASGVAVTTTLPVTVASLPLPTGASTSALQTTINTTLGSPFQAGGSIGNTTFTVTQATGTNLHTVCDSGCSGGTSDVDDGTIASGQTTGLGLNLTQVFDGTNWKRFTIGTAGTAAAQVVTIQGIASMTKLLVTPDSVALPANQSVNVSQINGVTTTMGNGVSGTGVQRVTLASDGTGQVTLVDSGATTMTNTTAHALKTFPVDPNTGAALTVPSSGNGTSDSGTLRVAIASNNTAVAGFGVAATGGAPSQNAAGVGGLQSGLTGGTLGGITVCDLSKGINVTTATTTLMVTGVSGRQVRVCAFSLVTAAANNVQFISGTGATCGTGTTGIGGGGTTSGSGYNLAANGGITIGSGLGQLFTTTATGDSLCAVTSASTQLSGIITYTIY